MDIATVKVTRDVKPGETGQVGRIHRVPGCWKYNGGKDVLQTFFEGSAVPRWK